MRLRSAWFRAAVVRGVKAAVRGIDVDARSPAELKVYLNRLIEDLRHDLDRFARDGLRGTVRGRDESVAREARARRERVEQGVVSRVTNAAFIDRLPRDEVRRLSTEVELRLSLEMDRLGFSFAGPDGEADPHDEVPSDSRAWLAGRISSLLRGYELGDLAAGEVRELHAAVDAVLSRFAP